MNYEQILIEIMANERYQNGIRWGKPRSGHPEGTIAAHIAELEENLERLSSRLSGDESAKIRLLIHTHDTFKGEAKSGVALINPQSHASIACRFLAEFCDEADLLNMAQFHDEHYAIFWRIKPETGFDQDRLASLFARIRDWNLFLAFIVVDGCTKGKSANPVEWIIRQSAGFVESRVDESWIIRHTYG
jgi:hypothetical protein